MRPFCFIIPLSVLNKSPDKDTVDKFADRRALIWSKGEESKKVNSKCAIISSWGKRFVVLLYKSLKSPSMVTFSYIQTFRSIAEATY